ncbi:hypothetical protein [Paenibacillus apis]|uniref:Uncharacterized protein n=1 Tax=Paenibacillus apis TaxID=1792174 RepID=A0A919Y662_9BACL|nr:hypothetical protein [Paenibacillus apis]GIO43158.1 hypothetical protein J41TS4_29160 [Paenibacillus apis]
MEDLSTEGWELVCPLVNEIGYILRATDYIDDTITIYDYDGEFELNEEEMKK